MHSSFPNTTLNTMRARRVARGYTCTITLNDKPFVSMLPVSDRNDSVINAARMVNHLIRGLVQTLADLSDPLLAYDQTRVCVAGCGLAAEAGSIYCTGCQSARHFPDHPYYIG